MFLGFNVSTPWESAVVIFNALLSLGLNVGFREQVHLVGEYVENTLRV